MASAAQKTAIEIQAYEEDAVREAEAQAANAAKVTAVNITGIPGTSGSNGSLLDDGTTLTEPLLAV